VLPKGVHQPAVLGCDLEVPLGSQRREHSAGLSHRKRGLKRRPTAVGFPRRTSAWSNSFSLMPSAWFGPAGTSGTATDAHLRHTLQRAPLGANPLERPARTKPSGRSSSAKAPPPAKLRKPKVAPPLVVYAGLGTLL
jgi:hypothetical protein